MDFLRCDKAIDCCHNEDESRELHRSRRLKHIKGMEYRSPSHPGSGVDEKLSQYQAGYFTASTHEAHNGITSQRLRHADTQVGADSGPATGRSESSDRSTAGYRPGDQRYLNSSSEEGTFHSRKFHNHSILDRSAQEAIV